VDALKARQHLAVVAMKEAASAAVNAEAATGNKVVETIAEARVLQVVVINVVAEAVPVDLTVQVAQVQAVPVEAVRVVTVQAARVRDNKRI